ncbi:S1 RNA-binding domain-containing protein 1-like [Gigantopelta aegis]|uniref:S1 RNA-binding domain-containing protein 1-like n=1 Tax=Gigantopelta aegis TaxID=1735272 RepID=UPI001B88C998|nr:S1 RNA-binding domain-containing protein 1-like [Gigantopelta aegis]XP_041352809.1 S1 RNA-binding domain-containing protein 1-like [Gigantopelta aegis]
MASSSTVKADKATPAWKIPEVISENVDVSLDVSFNVVKLLDEGATIPFIARYRKEQTGNMEVDKLREISSLVEELKTVESKIASVSAVINSQGNMSQSLNASLRNARTLHEVELLYAPFKPGHKGSLAERARKLGLEPPAMKILDGRLVALKQFINTEEKGLSNEAAVEIGIRHIIADFISKDKDIMNEVRRLCTNSNVTIETSQSKTTSKVKADKENEKKVKDFKKPKDQSYKFEQYFDYKIPVKYIQSHQVLAINRGEDKKILVVKVIIPDFVKNKLTLFSHRKWIHHNTCDQARILIQKSVTDAYDRLIQPQMSRLIRSDLTKKAEKESILVFASNLNSLLLTPPVRGKTVLGVDPGFSHGCKCAVISVTGQILDTFIVHLNYKSQNTFEDQQKIIDAVNKFRCEVIAIGNGVACRETEKAIGNLIQKKRFNVRAIAYCIVDECGASIYSVSDEAKKEMPQLDPSLRGAVSIARRLQDPLSEFVKVEAKHLGVGMYQHDISESRLKTSLDSVVEECVSFVGVDINTGSECLLRRIAGLNASKAKQIVECREKNGAFLNRQQLLSVKGLGQKGFEQCAGFIRVLHDFNDPDIRQKCEETAEPECDSEVSAKSGRGRKRKAGTTRKAKKIKLDENQAPNPLDMTAIHPESYHIAMSFLKELGMSVLDIGQSRFIDRVTQEVAVKGVEKLAKSFEIGEPTMKLITDALSKPISYDIRDSFDKPLFKEGVTAIESLKVHQKLTGRVTNVTNFGAFVDIGVGQNGLIHVSQMKEGLKGHSGLQLGDHVDVEVINIDIKRQRIGLRLIRLTSS